MEPEWNHPPSMDDATILGLKQSFSTVYYFDWLKNRTWNFRFSILKRHCYLTGENLQFKFGYIGRKRIKNVLSGNKVIYDDVWISQKEFCNLMLSEKLFG